jgi:putative photosynthetic complex assembly protein 2
MNSVDIVIAAAYTAFVWWFCTGVIFYLDGLHKRTYWVSLGAATFVAACAIIGVIASSRIETVPSAYVAFTCAVLVWGWQEMFFLMGVLAGPSKAPLPEGVSESTRFKLAARSVIHHELALLGVGILLLLLTWRSPNQVGGATYLLLWLMRLSAKLNLFVGVRNTYAHLLPAHIAYLGSFFRQRRAVSAFFVVSTAFATALTTSLWLFVIYGTSQFFSQTGASLIASLMTLAVIEHLFLVLPIPMERLWSAALASRNSAGQSHRPKSTKDATAVIATADLSSVSK